MVFENIAGLLKPYVPNILLMVFFIALTSIALGSTNFILRFLYKHFKIPRGHYLTMRAFIRVIIAFVGFILVVVSIPGINQQLIALIGIGLGVLVSLSATTTIGNAVAGLIIYLTRPIHEGDTVDIDGVFGDVISIELLFVHIKTVKNEIVSIPALKVLNSKIINYSSLDLFIVHFPISLGYDLDPGLVEKLLLKASSSCDGILKTPEPFVLIQNLKDFTVEYELNGYTDKPSKKITLESNLRRAIIFHFSTAGVQIMSPAQLMMHQAPTLEKVIPDRVTYFEEEKHDVVPAAEEVKKEVAQAKQKIEEKKRLDIKIKGE
ncbi:MAG TPA: mechanosensitive ion channel [Candidatus Altiarchaeales archaeon]|nr:mechanosensitive ion channel [Candidatus Altiarchaeales archaeon]